MNLFPKAEGNTPLSADEQADLIPDLATQEELNEWERQNILEAYAWALAPNGLRRRDPLVEPYVRAVSYTHLDVYKRQASCRGPPYRNGLRHG